MSEKREVIDSLAKEILNKYIIGKSMVTKATTNSTKQNVREENGAEKSIMVYEYRHETHMYFIIKYFIQYCTPLLYSTLLQSTLAETFTSNNK